MTQPDASLAQPVPNDQARRLALVTEGDWRLTESDRPLSLAEQIAERISRDILHGVYEPGERIIEQSIADAFQVSRGPVRDAIRILERESVVEILPRRGAQVTALSVKEIDDIFAIRAALIALGVSLATPLLSEPEIAQIKSWIGQLAKTSTRAASPDDYVPISYHISLYISRRCQNDRLYEMIRSMSRQTLRYSHLALASDERRNRSAELWAEFALALDARDAETTGNIARRLVEESGAAARAKLKEDLDSAEV